MNTDMPKRLHEAGNLIEAKGVDGVFPVRIITEGKGSSGVYSRELLKEYAEAFTGAPSFMNHPLDPEHPEHRDVTGIAGKIVSGIRYEERDGVAALYADLKVDKRWREFVEDYSDTIGLSVYILGTGKEQNGEYVVESFDGTDPYKSVDFVVAAGRGGRVERAMESLRVIEAEIGSPGSQTERENMLTKEDLVAALAEMKSQVVAEVTENLKAKEVESGSVEEFAEALLKADLPESSRKAVYTAIEEGKAPAEALAEHAALVTELRKALTESAGEDESTGRTIGRQSEQKTSVGTLGIFQPAKGA